MSRKTTQFELVTQTYRSKTFYGFSRKGSDSFTLVGENRREALQVIHRLQYGEPYIPVEGESHNSVDDLEEISDSDTLTTDDTAEWRRSTEHI